MKQKAKKQQAMLKKVEEQMHEKDEELQRRLVSESEGPDAIVTSQSSKKVNFQSFFFENS